MNASALLTSQGWRGEGHSLHMTDDSVGLAKPLLLNRKDNTKGIGATQHFTSDQWWMNAFDEQLQGLDTTKKGKVVQTVKTGRLNALERGSLAKYSLYATFVRGGLLEGSIQEEKKESRNDYDDDDDDESTSSESDSDSDEKKQTKAKPVTVEAKETKEERRARKEAKRIRREARAQRRLARKSKKSKSKSDSSDDVDSDKALRKLARKSKKAKSKSDSSDDADEEKRRRRARKEEKRRRRKENEGK